MLIDGLSAGQGLAFGGGPNARCNFRQERRLKYLP